MPPERDPLSANDNEIALTATLDVLRERLRLANLAAFASEPEPADARDRLVRVAALSLLGVESFDRARAGIA